MVIPVTGCMCSHHKYQHRIPTMLMASRDRQPQNVMDNIHKSSLLFESFFPSQGVHLQQDPTERYPLYLQVQTYNRSTNQQTNHQDEPLQGHRLKWFLKCDTNSLCISAHPSSRMPLPCNIPSYNCAQVKCYFMCASGVILQFASLIN